MRFKVSVKILFFLFSVNFCIAQNKPIDDKKFFKEEEPIKVKLITDIKSIIADKDSMNYTDGTISCIFPDGSIVNSQVKLKPRGNFRKLYCKFASLTIDFKADTTSPLKKLGTLKFVGGCTFSEIDEQLLLKEYLVYKIYNMLTNFSFRVRLLHVTYTDSKEKVKPFTQYAFLIEDVDDLAKRNDFREKERTRYAPNSVNRDQGTLLYLFQYMIGNTDWSIPYYHNIKMMVNKRDTFEMPVPIPYDFDISGLVNPYYGGPPPDLGITKLTERLYRGYPRTEEELALVVKRFLEKEEAIYTLINKFELLTKQNKKAMISFLGEFFLEIKNPKMVKKQFIDNTLEN